MVTSVMCTHVTPNDGTAVYLSAVSLTVAFPAVVVDDANCTVLFVMYKHGGVWRSLKQGQQGIAIVAAANVVTVNGAGSVFTNGDSFHVGLVLDPKEKV